MIDWGEGGEKKTKLILNFSFEEKTTKSPIFPFLFEIQKERKFICPHIFHKSLQKQKMWE